MNKLRNIGLAGSLLGMSLTVPSFCGGGPPPDLPPSLGPGVIVNGPNNNEGVSYGVWGEEGYYKIYMICMHFSGMGPGTSRESIDMYHPGGGTALHPYRYYTLYCPPNYDFYDSWSFTWD